MKLLLSALAISTMAWLISPTWAMGLAALGICGFFAVAVYVILFY